MAKLVKLRLDRGEIIPPEEGKFYVVQEPSIIFEGKHGWNCDWNYNPQSVMGKIQQLQRKQNYGRLFPYNQE